jgi:hypothetical protein
MSRAISTGPSHRARRRARVDAAYEKMKRKRHEDGLPEPKWHENPLTLIMFTLMPIGIVGGVVQIAIDNPAVSIIVGAVVVVVVGAAGLTCRGVGELKKSPELKAVGYFLGAGAYAVTAMVALINGLRLIP